MKDCRYMKHYRIDKTKNIGNVIFVVEGGRPESGGTELRLLKKIFAEILDYEVQELRRGCDEFIGHGKNTHYHVFALNLPKNQLTELSEESIDELFRRLKEEFSIKPEDCPIFFLYDRDVLSYHKNELRGKYVKKYTDPYGNENGDQGQLLLSYPAVESFLLSCIRNNACRHTARLGRDAKTLLRKAICHEEEDIDNLHQKTVDLVFSEDVSEAEKRLVHSINEMDMGLDLIGAGVYDLDNLGPTMLKVYDVQQQKYNSTNTFTVLSLIGMALLELGVIVECDENDKELEESTCK